MPLTPAKTGPTRPVPPSLPCTMHPMPFGRNIAVYIAHTACALNCHSFFCERGTKQLIFNNWFYPLCKAYLASGGHFMPKMVIQPVK